MAESPKGLTASPGENDALSDVLRSIRLTGALQFSFTARGPWQTPAEPPMAVGGNLVPFHIIAEGDCWLKTKEREATLGAGDIIAFPFDADHQLGVGRMGPVVDPVVDLPPKPWRELPVLRYGTDGPAVRILCGFLQCDRLNFRPMRSAMPPLVHVRTSATEQATWFGATIAQMVEVADRPRTGGLAVLERLTEIIFIELLRHQIVAAVGVSGWLAALADPALGRCLALIHEDPACDWAVQDLAAGAGLSRSTLAERFETVLGTSPIRYLREWRLCLASVALSTTAKPIAHVAHEAGYSTEAAFTRAFSRAYGTPPAAWRQAARQAQA